MVSPVNFNTFSEEYFIKFALDSLMANIRDDSQRKYLTKTRLVKFIVFIAEKLNYTNLTYGWYRHGFYSPVAVPFPLRKITAPINRRTHPVRTRKSPMRRDNQCTGQLRQNSRW